MKPNTSKLMIKNDSCLIIQPSLASIIGWKEALFLQQIHYWAITKPYKKKLLENVNWVRNPISEWEKNFFVLAKERTIKKTMKKLSDLGLIIKQKDPTTHKCDQTLIYRVNYSKVFELNPEFEAGFDVQFELENDKFRQSIVHSLHFVEGSYYPLSIETNKETKINEASFVDEKQAETKKPSKADILARVTKKVEEKKSNKPTLAEKWKDVDTLDLTPTQIWRMGFEEQFGRQTHLTGEDSTKLKQAYKKYPVEFHALVLMVLFDWSDFTYNVARDTGYDSRPSEPHTGYFCKFIEVAYTEYLRKGVEGGLFTPESEKSDLDDGSTMQIPDFLKDV